MGSTLTQTRIMMMNHQANQLICHPLSTLGAAPTADKTGLFQWKMEHTEFCCIMQRCEINTGRPLFSKQFSPSPPLRLVIFNYPERLLAKRGLHFKFSTVKALLTQPAISWCGQTERAVILLRPQRMNFQNEKKPPKRLLFLFSKPRILFPYSILSLS